MISRPVTIVNRLGLHARAATRLVNCSSEFASEIIIKKGTRSSKGKTNNGGLTQAAYPRTPQVIEARGNDEEQAIDAVARLILNRFGEEE
jgi:phosphocarrier protein HPr